MDKQGNIVFETKMFQNLLGNIFASQEEKFVFSTMFLGVDKLESIDSKVINNVF